MSDHDGDRPHLYSVSNHPHDDRDTTLEAAVLSALITGYDTDPTSCDEIINNLHHNDFADHRHQTIYDAILGVHAQGNGIAPYAVLENLNHYNAAPPGTRDYLHTLTENTAPPILALQYTKTLATYTLRRIVDETLTSLTNTRNHANNDDLIPRLQSTITTTTRNIEVYQHRTANPPEAQPINVFLAGEDEPYDWLVPGLLERGDRLIVTANEGTGKSTLLRQLGIQLAAGIHPFTLEPITPIRILTVDLENSQRQTRRKLRPLAIQTPGINPDNYQIICRIQGVNLTDPADITWLDNEITQSKCDVLITGPIYKMSHGNPNAEEDTKPVAMVIDALRARHNIAVILEAHSNKAGMGTTTRSKEPYGWSGWLRWPEFGIHLGDQGEVTHWRGMRDERDFPETLRKGGYWPWMPVETPHDQQWKAIKDAIKDANADLSQREIVKATGLPRTTVQNILREYGQQYRNLRALMPPKPPVEGLEDDGEDDDTDSSYPY